MVKGINPVNDYRKKEKQKIINKAKEAKRKIREAQKKANDPKKLTRNIEQLNLLEKAGRLRPEDRERRAQLLKRLEDVKSSKSKSSETHIDEALLKEAEEHTITPEIIMQQQQLLQQSFLSVPTPPPSDQQYLEYSNSYLPYPLPSVQTNIPVEQQFQPQQPVQQNIIQNDPLLDAYNGSPSSTDYLLQKPIGPKKLKKYVSENAVFIPRSVKTNFIKQITEEKKIEENKFTTNSINYNNNETSVFSAAPGPKVRKLTVKPQVNNINENDISSREEKKGDSTVPDDLDAFMKEIEGLNGVK